MENGITETSTTSKEGIVVSARDLKWIDRIRKEERQRYVGLLASLLVTAFLLYMFWEAPFAMHRLEQLPYSEASKSPFYETRFIVPWLIGVFTMIRGIYDCFFNRRRKLILKLANELEQNRRA